MPSKRQPFDPSGSLRQHEGDATHAIVEQLSRRFAAFRSDNPRHARVPRELRAAVTAAIRQGVAPGRLRRTCGLSTSQLDRWRRASGADVPTGARVFSVVDAPSPRADAVVGPQSDALELRLGPWSVRVRLAEEQEARRG